MLRYEDNNMRRYYEKENEKKYWKCFRQFCSLWHYTWFKILLIVILNYSLVSSGTCPQHTPYAYHGGAYCCHYSKEKDAYTVRGSQDANCDGGDISLTSECCEKDDFIACPSGTCTTPLFNTSEPCPEGFSNPYFYGLYCCKYNMEKPYFDKRPNGTSCQNNSLSLTSLCCLDDAFTPCPNPPCVGSPYWALTWHAEGNDDASDPTRFSRLVRYDSNGIVLGKGYKFLGRAPPNIKVDLEAAGIPSSTALALAFGGGKTGDEAGQYLTDQGLDTFVLTHAQQFSLFTITRDQHITTAQGLFSGFDSKDPAIRGIVIDLLWTGDYTDTTKVFLEQPIVQGFLPGLTTEIKDRSKWPNVTTDRFNRRSTYLD